MEPIGSTYGGNSSANVIARTEPRSGSEQGASPEPVTAAAPSSKVPLNGSGDRQLGVQLSEDSGQQEFKGYGPGVKQRPETPKETTPQEAQASEKDPSKEAPLTLSGEKKQEDPQVQQEVAQLKAIEGKVKAHEAAHKAAGGAMTGPISYSYTRGPDGRNYVTGGEVPISVSPGKTPQETISRMQQVIQAALAPADPSPQDRAVAGQAAQEMQKAQQQRNETPVSGNGQSPASSSESTAAEDSGQSAGSSSDAPRTKSVSGSSETRPQSENSANALNAQASRAYSDPSVSGKGDSTRDPSAFEVSMIVTGNQPESSPSRERNQNSSALSPSQITGLGPQPVMSRYA